jgi:hypothetical protein
MTPCSPVNGSRVTVVGIVIVIFYKTWRLPLGPTQPPVQWVPEVNRPAARSWPLLSRTTVKNEWSWNITSLLSLNPRTGTALDSRSRQYVSPKRPSPLTGFHGVVTRSTTIENLRLPDCSPDEWLSLPYRGREFLFATLWMVFNYVGPCLRAFDFQRL